VAGEVETRKGGQTPVTWRRVVVGVIGLYLLLFVVFNRGRVHVSFVVFSVRTRLLIALIFVAALGFLAGFVVRGRRSSDGNR
jgi:uncharacterized integral membrane protein